MSIGTRLKELRLSAGLTQVQLAHAAGITQNALTFYENDKKVPSAPRLAAIAKALGTTVEDLVDESSLPSIPEQHPDRRVHGNSTAAQIHKIVQQLGLEAQRDILKQARLLLTVQTADQNKNDHKRPRKVA
ncbi:MAG: helix-turn-helix domain-containing protein [Planctomycetes bacterium]|nr:helix-turn-helix domain-containing protein [Planctomycetota bacterium]